jgi:predicted ATPase/class 3 adenylate cyclase
MRHGWAHAVGSRLVPAELPSGTVTFLFTDVEGSTQLLDELGSVRYAEALGRHRAIVREALAEHGGVEVDTQGDAFFCAFASARSAVGCAAQVRAGLADGPIRVRMGIHTGEPLLMDTHYVGMDVHRAARIGACGHGGQVVISPTTVALLEQGEDVLRDLGAHRLKDLAAPVVLYQLGDEEFPPLKTLSRTNLPVPATAFLGREDELRDLLDRAAEPGLRVLTLTGPGGTGKTRLGLQLAAEISGAFTDGVWWVPLASLRDEALVASALASALDVDEEAGRPLAASIADSLARKRVLLLLDNCEHLVDAVAELVAAIVTACPDVLVLSTSRESLAVTGEQVFSVQPLVSRDAFELFQARARAAGAHVDEPGTHDVVAALCERLDNLPLAVELAAARSAALPPAALLERISSRLDVLKGPRDVDERQRTLRGTIAWSYDLLDARERRLFRRLSIFAGGATLEAIEEVCDADLDELLSLVAKSLVRQESSASAEPRYWMLETIREFAAFELEADDSVDAVRAAHFRWYVELAATARGRLEGPGSGAWLARLERDLANLRVAFGSALREPESGGEHRTDVGTLAVVLASLHMLHGRRGEAEDVIRDALALDLVPLDAAPLLSWLGGVLRYRRRADEAREAHFAAERALEPWPSRDAAWWESWIDVKLAQAHFFYFQAELDDLKRVIAELRPAVEAHGPPVQQLEFLHVVAQDAYRKERYALSPETEELVREIYRRSVELEDLYAEFTLGFCLLWRGKLEAAEEYLLRALESARVHGNAVVEVRCIVYALVSRRRRNDVEGARRLFGELDALEDLHGYGGLTRANAAWIAYRDGDLDRAVSLAEAALAEWDEEQRGGATVFQWAARFPLLGIELARRRPDAALEQARAMLDPAQQPLPHELSGLLERAVLDGDASMLGRALETARTRGFA